MSKFTLDSRLVEPGDTFVAIRGGLGFVDQAKARGAKDVIEGEEELARRAHEYRKTLKAKVVGVTGSAGKTTTKEFLKTFLGCYGTEGNYNNNLGLPLTLLNAPPEGEFLVAEMGTNHPGEIEALCRIAEPDVGVICSIGTAHLEFFKTQEGIAREKGVLFKWAKDFNAVPENCNQLAILRQMGGVPLIETETEGDLECPVPGEHNRSNMMLAYRVARELGVSRETCVERLKNFSLPGARWKKTKLGKVTFIDDSYNANPDSMKAAIDAFGGETVVLGDMGELGEESERLHREVLDYAYSKGKKVITVGKMFAKAEISRVIEGEVLLKGSHSMNLSSLIEERKN